MIKRMTKVTSLLVAAAAIVSLVPATGVSAAERLGTKEGTIENAIAFKDGKYLFEGYKSDDDDKALYYNDGTKDKELDDATEFVTISASVYYNGGSFDPTTVKYGDKYAMVADGSDNYVVDLSNGKVSDEGVQEDLMDNVRTKLKSKLDKTDRYDGVKNKGDLKIKKVDNGKFGDVWYQYEATTSSAATPIYGFVNEKGDYIDASNLAQISIFANNGQVKNKVVKVKEFSDKKDGVTVDLTKVDFLAQDKDNIYVLATVNVSGTGIAGQDTTRYFVQKLSKSQGDKKDDAYLPKSVASYELLKDTDIYNDDDTNDAYKALSGNDGQVVNVSAIGGSLYVTVLNSAGDNVKVEKLDLKKAKMDSKTAKKENIDAYVVKKDNDSDQDIDSDAKGYSIDANGYTWVINAGKIYKFDKLDKKVMFTCDRSLNTLEVYDEGSLIAWEDGEDVYTTVQEGKAASNTEVTPAQTGWVNTSAGWTFYDAAGKQVVGSWVNAGGVWYMIKADGIMATGWYNDNGTWYYLNASGAMQTGWFNDNGTWYYLQSSGAMKTGWFNDNGTWYYLNASGAMLANTTVDGYVLGASGALVK